jgi:hypothetical protein
MMVDYVRIYQEGVSSQQITFPAIEDKTLGGPSFALGATSNSGLPVTYKPSSNKITIVGDQVTMVSAGRVTITADQAGNASFAAAALVERTFCINPAKPVITMEDENTNGSLIPNETSSTLLVSVEGVYTVQVKVDDCESEVSEEISVVITGEVNSTLEAKVVYPNPAENYIQINGLQNKDVQAQISDLMGRTNSILFEQHESSHRANVQNLSKGIYIIKIVEGNTIYQFKVLVK